MEHSLGERQAWSKSSPHISVWLDILIKTPEEREKMLWEVTVPNTYNCMTLERFLNFSVPRLPMPKEKKDFMTGVSWEERAWHTVLSVAPHLFLQGSTTSQIWSPSGFRFKCSVPQTGLPDSSSGLCPSHLLTLRLELPGVTRKMKGGSGTSLCLKRSCNFILCVLRGQLKICDQERVWSNTCAKKSVAN